MSIHSSLRGAGKNKKHRSVLKRYERLKFLKDKSLWSEDKTVLGIPKVKMQRLKVKKEKAAAPETAAGAPAPAAGTAEKKTATPIGGAPAKGGPASGGKGKIVYCKNAKEALQNADALVILTDWAHFKKIKPEVIKRKMKHPVVFDGRNIFDSEKMKNLGFDYYSIGRKMLHGHRL